MPTVEHLEKPLTKKPYLYFVTQTIPIAVVPVWSYVVDDTTF